MELYHLGGLYYRCEVELTCVCYRLISIRVVLVSIGVVNQEESNYLLGRGYHGITVFHSIEIRVALQYAMFLFYVNVS